MEEFAIVHAHQIHTQILFSKNACLAPPLAKPVNLPRRALLANHHTSIIL